jgi:hypothetical protein
VKRSAPPDATAGRSFSDSLLKLQSRGCTLIRVVSLWRKVVATVAAVFALVAIPSLWLENAFPGYQRVLLALSISDIAVVVLVGIWIALWYVPNHDVEAFRAAGVSEEKLAELRLTSRTSITQAIGGVALIVTLALTAYQANGARQSANANVRIAEEGQLAERFSRAVDQLGATTPGGQPAIDVRVGALFALERIGEDSERDTQPALQTVAAYLNDNLQNRQDANYPSGTPCSHDHPERQQPRNDFRVALQYVLPGLGLSWLKQSHGGISPALQGTDFSRMDLNAITNTTFRGVLLDHVSFRDSDLGGTEFDTAGLVNVDFRDACLVGVQADDRSGFDHIDLRGADLRGASVPPEFFGFALTDKQTRR